MILLTQSLKTCYLFIMFNKDQTKTSLGVFTSVRHQMEFYFVVPCNKLRSIPSKIRENIILNTPSLALLYSLYDWFEITNCFCNNILLCILLQNKFTIYHNWFFILLNFKRLTLTWIEQGILNLPANKGGTYWITIIENSIV